MSLWKVSVFKQIGGLPNPAVDQLLCVDNTIETGLFSAQVVLSEGRHTIYALTYDIAGNVSNTTTKNIIVLPSPFEVSSKIDWPIGGSEP
jgi:hypothetical protein